jgi:hypothetical protein
MRIVIFILLAILTISCSKEKDSKIILDNSLKGRKLKRERDSVNYEEEKKRFPSSTYDLLAINSDTLVAATRYNGIIRTSDGGQTWTPLSSPGIISKLTIDDKDQVWGLYSWRGIHEADRSVLFHSRDFGKTWQTNELDTKTIFPAGFYSQSGDKLKVIDYNNKIYRLTNNNSVLKWELIDSLKEGQNFNPWVRRDVVTDSKKRRWIFDEEGIFLIDKDMVKVY